MTALIIAARILFVIVFFSLCIFVHELGHLLVGLWRGLFVERFSVGFGKRLWGIRYRGVDYILSLIPFGGYVALPQLDPTEEPCASDGTPLPHASAFSRALTALAGPVANIIFGFFLALFVWWLGIHGPAPASSCTVWKIPEVLPFFTDGLQPGDRIVSVDGVPTDGLWNDVVYSIPVSAKEIHLGIQRGTENLELLYHPEPNPEFLAGLRNGDEIVRVEGQAFTRGWEELSERIVLNTDDLHLTVMRNGQPLDIVYTPPPNPAVDGLGYPFFEVCSPVEAGRIFPGSPAARAGIRQGDRLVSLNGEKIPNSFFFVDKVRESAGAPLILVVERRGQRITIEDLRAVEENVNGEMLYRIGMGLDAPTVLVHPNPWQQFLDVLERTGRTLRSISAPITGKHTLVKVRHLSGPVGILQMIWYRVATEGIRGGLSFIVLLTFSLALFNLLPIPILDGGHILYAVIEVIIRRRLPTRFVYILQSAFAVLIITFMLYVTAFDVMRIPKFWRLARPEPEPAPREQAVSPGDSQTEKNSVPTTPDSKEQAAE